MIKLVVVASLVIVAVSIAAIVNRRSARHGAPTRTGGLVPDHVDRADFDPSGARWLLAVFTSATCDACAEVVTRARTMGGTTIDVRDIEFVRDRRLHEKYAIDTVPMTLLVDTDGHTVESWLGPIRLDEVATAIDEA